VEGAFPIRILTWNVGDRRPLGVSARREAVVRWLCDERDELTRHLEAVTNGLSAPILRRLRRR
jgi:hypothetical protein